MRWRKDGPRSRRISGGALLRDSIDDADAFHEFYVAYLERVLVFMTRRVFDAEIAADLTAESFAVAFHRRTQFRGETREEEQGWLFAIARSQLSRYWRRGEVERAALERLGVDPPELSTEDLEQIERMAGLEDLRGLVREALGALTDDQAYAVRQRVLAERSYAELADELSVSEQVIRARVSRGLKVMAEALSNVDLGERA